jgi:gamma-glutamyltranspeptidase / glutathione hydrolase
VAATLVPARLVRGKRGAVASPHYLASQAGLGILRAGGNAIDAAIATNAALAVVAAHSCGMGGDAFWLIWDGRTIHALNGSGRTARTATIDAAHAAGLDDMPIHGPWTVTVPGAIRSWGDAHARFGRLAWADLLAPAIDLADGFPATDGWSGSVERSARVFGANGDWARTFRQAGRPWRVGEVVRLPNLAQTLRTLAAEGPDTSYTGSLARQASTYLESAGSPLRAADFAAHASTWTQPIAIDYRGYTSVSHPPNSCGPIALEMLGMLRHFDPPAAFDEPRWVHLGLETARQGLADRDAYVTDLEHMEDNDLANLLDGDRLARLAARLDLDHAGRIPEAAVAGGDTIFLATGDADGNLVSLIESNYMGFGSGLVDPVTGISYQNRGAFCRLDANHANALAPSKRTMHTLTPGMLLRDGKPWIAHGSMGGEIQPQVFAQLVSAIVDGGADIATALALPRWAAHSEHHLGSPDTALLEGRFTRELAGELERRGHQVAWAADFDSGLGHANAVELVPSDNGTITLAAASDPRTEGAALAW